VDIRQRLQLERDYHESDDVRRNDNSLIVRVYSSGVFDEAETCQLDALGTITGKDVLDYGCGSGWSTAKLRARGASVTGFDISQTRLGEAQSHLTAGAGHVNVLLTQSVAESLPFANGTFDAVYGKQILHHLDLKLAVPEIARVLRPNGRAVFLEPLIHNPVLEGYRRRTPHLRSSTEKALSMQDLQHIGSYFKTWRHHEFCFLAIAPIVLQAIILKKARVTALVRWLQKVDRRLARAVPFVGRYYWETVIILQR
jgi:ubiquinone/menaquinone biosynthesis C-methylase UbiE